ncbi:hypothetical protein L9F63_007624, partial [Diploptera punctata]
SFCIRANARPSRSRRLQCYVKLTSCPSCGLTIISIVIVHAAIVIFCCIFNSILTNDTRQINALT